MAPAPAAKLHRSHVKRTGAWALPVAGAEPCPGAAPRRESEECRVERPGSPFTLVLPFCSLLYDADQSRSAAALIAGHAAGRRPQQRDVIQFHRHRSSGLRPVRFEILASILGPISSFSWKAKTKSAQPSLDSVRCEPDWRLTLPPVFSNADSTRLARVLDHCVMPR